MNDAPRTPVHESETIRRIKGVKALRIDNPGMSLAEAVRRYDAGERADDSDDYEYAWHWATEIDDIFLRSFSTSMSTDEIKQWCRDRSEQIAPVVLKKRPRQMWTSVEF